MADFVIHTNRDNEYKFTIKENGTTTALVLTGTDTFEAKLIHKEKRTLAKSFTMSITNQAGGITKLEIPAAQTTDLISERRGSSDKYALKETYELHIYADTTNGGKFTIKVPQVFVDIGYA